MPEGEYTLTARAYDNEGESKTSLSRNITVRVPVAVSGVELFDLGGSIAVGASIQMEALIFPEAANNQNMIYTSDDSSIATVSEDGFFTAVTEGIVNITVTTEDGGFVDSKEIPVLTPSTELNYALNQAVAGRKEK